MDAVFNSKVSKLRHSCFWPCKACRVGVLNVLIRRLKNKRLRSSFKIPLLRFKQSLAHSWVDKDSHQLQEFLEQSKDIIISTIQKFPKISETISQLKSKTFGVIIDEVHSSQTGETLKHLKKTISKGESGEEEDEELPDYEDLIREEIRNRGRLFFAAGSGSSRQASMNLCCGDVC